MSVTCHWQDDQKLIVMHDFTGDWSPQELLEAMTECFSMIEGVEHPAACVYNFLDAGKPGTGLIAALPQISRLMHPRAEMIILVGSRGLTSAAAQVYSRLYQTVHRVETVEDAVYLVEHRLRDSE
jgi:hypothetical protein